MIQPDFFFGQVSTPGVVAADLVVKTFFHRPKFRSVHPSLPNRMCAGFYDSVAVRFTGWIDCLLVACSSPSRACVDLLHYCDSIEIPTIVVGETHSLPIAFDVRSLGARRLPKSAIRTDLLHVRTVSRYPKTVGQAGSAEAERNASTCCSVTSASGLHQCRMTTCTTIVMEAERTCATDSYSG